jgi:ribosomal protein S18 acetylase RimI-like enzyme
MTQIRPMEERDAERVRDLWLQMCAEAGTPLPATSSPLILANLRQYATHQLVHCFVAEEQQIIIGFVTCWVSGHPVMPGLSGEIEELYVEARRHEVQSDLVRQALKAPRAQTAGVPSRPATLSACLA